MSEDEIKMDSLKDFKTYKKLKRLEDLELKDLFIDKDDGIVVQEKIDGANFRFYIVKGKVIFGSRNLVLEELERPKGFNRVIEFVMGKLKNVDLNKYNGMLFYGEACIRHTLTYNWETIPPFLGFDIYKDGEYLSYEEVERIYTELGLTTVPLLSITPAGDIPLPITDDFVPISKYSPEVDKDMKCEGVVFKNYSKQLFGKYVRDSFKEVNKDVFGKNKKDIKNDEDAFILKYCTNARIEKIILKEIDAGEQLSMKLMGTLIKKTYVDIIEEEWYDILTSNWTISFKDVRKKVTHRVKSVLQQLIENNYIERISSRK